MDLQNAGELADHLMTLLGGGLLVKLADLAIAKRRAQAREQPAVIKSAADYQHAVSEAAKDLLEDYRKQLGFVRDHCERLQQQLDHAREDLAAAALEHTGCRAELDKLRAEIDALKAAAPLFTQRGGS